QLEDYWNQRAVLCERCVRTNAAAAAFAGCVESGTVDSLVLFDAEGRISYPSAPSPVLSNRGEAESPWQEASKLEHGRKYTEAAKRYDHLAREAAYPDVAARGFQAEGRCLAQAGQTDAAVRLIDGIFSNGL